MKDALLTFCVPIAPLLAPLLLALMGVVVAKLNAYIAAHVKSKRWAGALSRLDDTVFTVVGDIAQTSANTLKADSADGKLTVDEAARLKTAAIAKVKTYLGESGLNDLCEILCLDPATVHDFLGSKIEAAVLKSAAVPTLAPVLPIKVVQ